MESTRTSSFVRSIAALTVLSISAAGCAVSNDSSSGKDGYDVAYLSASAANTWLASSREAMQKVADERDVTITEFDAKFTPGLQSKQIQDIISAKKYDGIVIASVDGVGVQPALENAIKAGLDVVVLNQVIGKELDTAEPQVPGVAASVLSPPLKTGERMGELALSACEGVVPCRVVYLYGAKGTPLDSAQRTGFDATIESNPDIEVIAEGEGGYLGTDQPRKTVQDILQSHPEFDVLVGTGDQQIRGALLALDDAGKKGVKVIGVGGSEPAIEAIKAGTWYGDVAGVPGDEGTQAIEALIAAMADGTVTGGIDTAEDLPNGGLITQDNVTLFAPQWKG
ncbi:sugar ABC transporter substrate-binding protein [Nocardioides sp. LHD-245]|uniref:sugar ABC transporter substrate-binding protein n=1 Tax=Nocardioides sp. LHD-245 TaxID=3051387 RepID=UPI0027E05D79|nr:sugar ABC transporter substrate-binding protein [Nocardioides sp. LHD-245]